MHVRREVELDDRIGQELELLLPQAGQPEEEPEMAAAVSAVVEPLEEEPTDHGEQAEAQAEVWKWHDPYRELSPDQRMLAYLAHMCELMERAERRAQQQDPRRDPVLAEALDQAQARYARGKGRDELISKGLSVGLGAVGEVARGRRLTPGAVISALAGFGLAASIALFGFVLDHLDVLLALVRGL